MLDFHNVNGESLQLEPIATGTMKHLLNFLEMFLELSVYSFLCAYIFITPLCFSLYYYNMAVS
jgi:hypothetical protein